MIRPATAADWDGLVALAQGEGRVVSVARVRQTFEALLAHGAVWVAVEGAQVVGAIGVRVVSALASDVAFADIVVWFIEPGHRSSRDGPALLAAVEAWALTQSVRRVKISSPTGSTVGRYLAHRAYDAVEQVYTKALA